MNNDKYLVIVDNFEPRIVGFDEYRQLAAWAKSRNLVITVVPVDNDMVEDLLAVI